MTLFSRGKGSRVAALIMLAGSSCVLAPVISAQKPLERDSAGIRIVENPSREASPATFRLGAPAVDIGGASDNPNDEMRNAGAFALRLNSTTILVTEGTRVGVFASNGKRMSSIGRTGAGPGEFRTASEICRTRGDTIVINDSHNGRFSVMYRNVVVHSAPYSTFGTHLAGCFDDGTVLLTGGQSSYGILTFVMRLNRVRLDGTLVNAFPDMTFLSSDIVTHLLLPNVRVRGQRVYAGDGASSEIRVFHASGRLIQIIRTADSRKKVTAADLERALAGTVPRVRNGKHNELFPAYGKFLLDDNGRVWVQDFVPTLSARQSWTAIDQDGRIAGRVDVPWRATNDIYEVVQFGSNEVQMHHFDSDGFPHLTFYPIERR